MNGTLDDSLQLATDVVRGCSRGDSLDGKQNHVDVVICPPFPFLQAVGNIVTGTSVGLGAQNCYHEPRGAYTGEVSATMIAQVGCRWVIVGHSERRKYFHESNNVIAAKAMAALKAGISPIVCVGETLEDRSQSRTFSVIEEQVSEFVHHAGSGTLASCILAYEPVWAIGTGKAATPEQAAEVHSFIRGYCESSFNLSPTIIYGGSVTPDNALALFSMPNIDGALVGGASLDAALFLAIVNAAEGA